MEKIKPVVKIFVQGLIALIIALACFLFPVSNCSRVDAAGTESYLLLDYIEADGTQYIDTGYVPSSATKWVMDFQYTSTPAGTGQQFGCQNTTSERFLLAIAAGNNHFIAFASGATSKDYGSADTNRHTFIIDMLNLQASLDSTTQTYTLSTMPNTSMFLFAVNSNGNPAVYSSAKLYSSQIYDNGVLVRDFVPVKRTFDGEIGLLDRVNDVFYANQGTGDFTAGYLADDYYVCSYLESDGTQYIDTGVIPTNDEQLSSSFQAVSLTGNTIVFGSYNNGLRDFVYLTGTEWRFYNTSSVNPGSADLSKQNLSTFINDGATTNCLWNGYSFTSTKAVSSLATNNIMLFGGPGSSYSYFTGRIYSFNLVQSGIAVRNMIPVYDPNTNTAGMWDNVNGVWYGNDGTGDFSYVLSGGASVTTVADEYALNSALNGASLGDLVVLTGDVTVSTKTMLTQDATVYWGSHSLSSDSHPANYLYTTEGWYSTMWTTKATNKLLPNTTYNARFHININSLSVWVVAFTNWFDGDIIDLTGGFTYNNTSFTIPANVTVNKNGYTILPPIQSVLTRVGFNTDPSAGTDAVSFVAGNTYYAVYQAPTYTGRLIVDTDVTIDISGIPGAVRTEYASYSSIDFSYTYGDAIQFPVPTRSLYSFNGWYLNGTDGPYTGISSTDYDNKVFYAKWVEAPTISIGNVDVYRNLINEDDRLIIFTYDIVWQNLPNDNVRTLFMFRLMDPSGTDVLASTQPYYYYYGGYYMGVAGFYFPDDSVIDWGDEYQIRIDGNPSKWYTISDVKASYDLTNVNYTESSDNSGNQSELAGWIINISQALENDWTDLTTAFITTNSSGNTVLTSTGQSYYLNTIANINLMAPSIFSQGTATISPSPSNPIPEVPSTPSLIDRWESQYEGTWVQSSFQGLGDLFNVEWRTITSILCLVLWVVFAAFSQMRWGTTDAGLWMGAVMFGVMITMGLMNWAVVVTAAILMALYSLYIIFWRQG